MNENRPHKSLFMESWAWQKQCSGAVGLPDFLPPAIFKRLTRGELHRDRLWRTYATEEEAMDDMREAARSTTFDVEI